MIEDTNLRIMHRRVAYGNTTPFTVDAGVDNDGPYIMLGFRRLTTEQTETLVVSLLRAVKVLRKHLKDAK